MPSIVLAIASSTGFLKYKYWIPYEPINLLDEIPTPLINSVIALCNSLGVAIATSGSPISKSDPLVIK